MRFKADSEDTQEYPQTGRITEKDLKMSHCTTRQYWEEQDRGQDLQAGNNFWKKKHPEWFPDKNGLPWDEYWKRFWTNVNKEEK